MNQKIYHRFNEAVLFGERWFFDRWKMNQSTPCNMFDSRIED